MFFSAFLLLKWKLKAAFRETTFLGPFFVEWKWKAVYSETTYLVNFFPEMKIKRVVQWDKFFSPIFLLKWKLKAVYSETSIFGPFFYPNENRFTVRQVTENSDCDVLWMILMDDPLCSFRHKLKTFQERKTTIGAPFSEYFWYSMLTLFEGHPQCCFTVMVMAETSGAFLIKCEF